MAWRDDYRPGAFRGVPFHLKTSSATGGRRTVLNEFPLRDEPFTEDMGRRGRQYQLSMTVIGTDYMSQRDRLIEALETAGPGTLMHPFRGELYVAVMGDYSCEESTEQGGLARISATFVEAGAKPQPGSQQAQGSLGNAAADAVQADAVAEFEEEFSIVGFASFVTDEAIDSLQAASQSIREAGGFSQTVGDFGVKFRRLTSSFQQLVLAPGNLAGETLGVIRSLSNGTSDPLQALKAQMALFGLGNKAKRVSNNNGYQAPARAQVASNQKAIHRLVERAALGEAVRLAVSKPNTVSATNPVAGIGYDSRDQAAQIRDQLLNELDRQQLDASPARYRLLARLSAALVGELNGRAASLVPVTRITPPVTVPALLLAQRLYGDARQAEQLVMRNRLSHPGFVPGGVELEVMKNA